jgi:hypothetical protein
MAMMRTLEDDTVKVSRRHALLVTRASSALDDVFADVSVDGRQLLTSLLQLSDRLQKQRAAVSQQLEAVENPTMERAL